MQVDTLGKLITDIMKRERLGNLYVTYHAKISGAYFSSIKHDRAQCSVEVYEKIKSILCKNEEDELLFLKFKPGPLRRKRKNSSQKDAKAIYSSQQRDELLLDICKNIYKIRAKHIAAIKGILDSALFRSYSEKNEQSAAFIETSASSTTH